MAELRSANLALGRAVRALREERVISQEDLADESGLDRTYVSGIERGLRNVSLDTLLKLAEGMNTTAATIVERTEKELGRH